MDGHDLEMEKARLLSLALDFGFDEESAKKCLDRLVHLYGTHCHTNPSIFFSNPLFGCRESVGKE